MVRSSRVVPVVFACSALTLAACSSSGDSSSDSSSDDITIVATTTQLGSIVGDIAQCGGANEVTIMGPGDDPHSFAPSSEQIATMSRASLVVANGLGLEEGLHDALDTAKGEGTAIFEVAPELDPIPFTQEETDEHEHAHDDHDHGEEDHDHSHDHADEGHEHAGHDHDHAEDAHEHDHGDDTHEHDHDHGEDGGEHHHHHHHHGSEDPHVWMDVNRMATAAALIGDKLSEVTSHSTFAECGKKVQANLQDTDKEVRNILARVPQDKRVLVTDHDAFGYFAKAYNFTILGTVIPSSSTQASASSEGLASLAATVKQANVPAIFSNTAASDSLPKALASEVGSDVKVVPLYVGSVGPQDSDAATYAGMMVSNAHAVADALS